MSRCLPIFPRQRTSPREAHGPAFIPNPTFCDRPPKAAFENLHAAPLAAVVPFAVRAGLRKIALGEVLRTTLRGLPQPGPRRSAGENCCHWDPRHGRLRATLGATPGGYTGKPGRAKRPYFTGF